MDPAKCPALYRALARGLEWAPPASETETSEPDEDLCYDGSLRLVAAAENPFARGKAWTAFEVVELAGEKGVSYEYLMNALAKLFEWTKERAAKLAQKMFKRWVEKGWLQVK